MMDKVQSRLKVVVVVAATEQLVGPSFEGLRLLDGKRACQPHGHPVALWVDDA